MPHAQKSRRRLPGFTLIELLVVISIISLIMSLLLPALSGARRSSQYVVCQTNLREIGNGMSQYSNDNSDWIVGSPAGSGAYLSGSFAYGPATQVWDFLGPIANQFGIPLPMDSGNTDTIRRFNIIRGYKGFLCPSNQFLSTWYAGPKAGAGPMVSYNTTRYMMFEHVDQASGSPSPGVRTYDNTHEQKIPTNWSPRIGRLGDTSRKIFAADGSRFATGGPAGIPPDYDLSARASWGGAFSDVGPYSTFTRSWDRSGMSGSGVDARIYAFRHSIAAPQEKSPANVPKFNAVFFDGHVERMGDLQAANPRFYLPAGSTLEPGSTYADVQREYGLTQPLKINN